MAEPAAPSGAASGAAPAASPEAAPAHERPIAPRSDLKDAAGWIAFGVAVLVGSVRMDRLERQHINPYTIPGLLPGLLGIAMILLGGLLALRSVRRGALRRGLPAPTADDREHRRRVWFVLALCTGYGVGLVGHGLPFWLASAIYVAGSIVVMQSISRDPAERNLTARSLATALVVALGTGIVTQLVFQEMFLVRLP